MNSFSPLEKSPSSKKQAVSVANDQPDKDTSISTSQSKVESCRPKIQGSTKIETKIDHPIKKEREKESRIPTISSTRKPKLSIQHFLKDPKDKGPQSKQDKTGKKHC